MVKTFLVNAGDAGLIPGLGRSPGEGNGNTLQYFAWKIPWTEESGGLYCALRERERQRDTDTQTHKDIQTNTHMMCPVRERERERERDTHTHTHTIHRHRYTHTHTMCPVIGCQNDSTLLDTNTLAA